MSTTTPRTNQRAEKHEYQNESEVLGRTHDISRAKELEKEKVEVGV